jgi:hypothetical protein
MSDDSSIEGRAASFSFDIKYMQEGRYSVLLFLPEAYHAPIGLIVAYWGNFEVVFDSCLEGLIAGEIADGKVRDTSGWKRQSFRRRRKLFKDICKEWLMTWRPDEADRLIAIIDAASQLQSRRNLIAHGTYGYSIPPHSSVAQECYAFNGSTNEKMPFDEEVLKRIYHEISHVTADLVHTFQSFGKISGPYSQLADAEILRVYRETVHQWNPDPGKRPNAA